MEGECLAEERPTDEQLAAVDYVYKEEGNPSPDLAIFGPYGNRLQRKLTMCGLTPAGFGQFRRVELKGPPDLAT